MDKRIDRRELLEDEDDEIPSHTNVTRLLLIILLLLAIFTFGVNLLREWYISPKNDESPWDTIIFSQQWPYTYCQQWEEKSSSHSCRLPPPGEYVWTIHGLWPTKLGTRGPLFCDPSMKFDKDAISSIENDLNKQWLDIQSGSDPHSFWKHEWDKHGTCALSDKSLNSEFDYFNQGLKWNREYPIGSILQKGGIIPGTTDDSSYSIYDYWKALTDNLQHKPYITCIKDKINHKYYISEVRICFDKSLSLIDCGGVGYGKRKSRKVGSQPQTNCPANDPIIYRK